MNIVDKINKTIATVDRAEVVSIILNEEDGIELDSLQITPTSPRLPMSIIPKLGRDTSLWHSEIVLRFSDGSLANRNPVLKTFYLETGAKVTPGLNTKSPSAIWSEEYKNAKARADADMSLTKPNPEHLEGLLDAKIETKSINLKDIINVRLKDVDIQIHQTKVYIDQIVNLFDFDTNTSHLTSSAKSTLVTLEIEELFLVTVLKRL